MNAKQFEKYLRAIPVGESRQFRRQDSVITFIRNRDSITHHYGRGSMNYTGTFRSVAEWFTEDDGQGEHTEVPIAEMVEV